MSQKAQILNYLKRGRAITPLEALKLFGCFRLGARIWELRRAGHPIEKTWAAIDQRRRWAKYRLAKQ